MNTPREQMDSFAVRLQRLVDLGLHKGYPRGYNFVPEEGSTFLHVSGFVESDRYRDGAIYCNDPFLELRWGLKIPTSLHFYCTPQGVWEYWIDIPNLAWGYWKFSRDGYLSKLVVVPADAPVPQRFVEFDPEFDDGLVSYTIEEPDALDVEGVCQFLQTSERCVRLGCLDEDREEVETYLSGDVLPFSFEDLQRWVR